MSQRPPSPSSRPSSGLPRGASVTAVSAGVLVLLAWVLGLDPLRQVLPGWVSMKANTAVGFMLTGLSLWLLPARQEDAGRRALSRACALGAALLGSLTLSQDLWGWDAGIDQLLVREASPSSGATVPGRMAPTTASCFVLTGLALLLLARGGRRRDMAAQLLASLAALVSLLALVGHSYGVEAFYSVASPARMPLHTALVFLVLAPGVLLARPEHGAAAFLTGDLVGNALARRLLPAGVGIPLALGWLKLLGQRAGLYENELGVALVAVFSVVLFAAVVLGNAALLNRSDLRRRQVESALTASEVRFRSLSESTSDAVVIANGSGSIVSWNRGAQAMFGYREEETCGRPVSILMPERYREGHRTGLERLARTGEARLIGRTIELHGLRKDGTEFPLEISLSTWRIPEGTYFGAIVRDSTERRRTEAALRERTAQLEVANQELETFSYSVSHDLRAPLRAVDGFSRAVLEEYADRLDPKGQDYLGRVQASCEEMAELIDGLLTLSRVTRMEILIAEVDLTAIARDIAARLERLEPGRATQFEIQSGLVGNGDPRMLRVVLENLIGNAWKFTKGRESARIQIGSKESDDGRAFFVRDDGAGFDMAYADKLFGAFQRLHSSREFEGTGIGLATVERIIRRHGGRVWAEGQVNGGATFYFAF